MNIEKILKEIEELILEQEYSIAEKYLLRIMDKGPEHPEVHYLLGEVYCKLRKFALAIEQEAIANRLLPGNPQILDLLGWAYFMNGNIVNGRKYIQQALQLNPIEVRSLCDLIVLETRAGNKVALGYAQKALQIAPQDTMVQEVSSLAYHIFTRNKKV
jgi:tetratricopeptide (TPR) repeat protein